MSTEPSITLSAKTLETNPCLVDMIGNLFALDATDKSTVHVDGPGTGNGFYIGAGRCGRNNSWIGTSEFVAVSTGEGWKSIILDKARREIRRVNSSYPSVICIGGERDDKPVVITSLNGIVDCHFFDGRESLNVSKANFEPLCGWRSGPFLYLAGSTGRVVGRKSEVKRGRPVVGRIRFSASKHELEFEILDGKKFQPPSQEIEGKPGELALVVEAWTGVSRCNDDVLLVGGITTNWPQEEDDYLSQHFDARDFSATGVFLLEEVGLVPVEVFKEYVPLQVVESVESARLYMMSSDDRTLNGVVCRMMSESRKENANVRFSGLEGGAGLLFFNVSFSPDVGYFGSIGVPGTEYLFDTYLIRSEDGIHWMVEHKLATIGNF